MINLIVCFLTLGFASCFPELYLYDRDIPQYGVNIINTPIAKTKFDRSKSTIFVIHGIAYDHLHILIQQLKDQLLFHTTDNILLVDWEKNDPAYTYNAAVEQLPIIALKISEFIKVNNISASNIHCIGHSLGAHMCGFIGKQQKLKRISGLDPAGPLYRNVSESGRLSKSDADFVDVIHTDGIFGIEIALGHKDFYPFGGQRQVGCKVSDFLFGLLMSNTKIDEIAYEMVPLEFNNQIIYDNLNNCSHQRAIELFAASLNKNCTFQSVPCDNYDDFKKGKCICDPEMGCSYMGYFADQNRQEGKFYLQTSASFPFCNK